MTFTEQLDTKGIEWKHGSKEGEIVLCCPFCSEVRFRLGVNLVNGAGHCFNCDWGSKKDTVKKVLEALEIESDEEEKQEKQEKQREAKKKKFDGKLPHSFELLYPKKKDRDFLRAYGYLRHRGVTTKQLRKYKVGFCLSGKYSNRIVFPIYEHGKLRMFVTRDFTDKQDPKYLNSIGKKVLYGKKTKKIALLQEGVFDKLAAEMVIDYADCYAINGKRLKESQIEQLKGYKQIIRVADKDGPGIRGALKDLQKLKKEGFENLYFSTLENYKDASLAWEKRDYEAINNLVAKASQFTWAFEMQLKTLLATEYRGKI